MTAGGKLSDDSENRAIPGQQCRDVGLTLHACFIDTCELVRKIDLAKC